VDLLRAGEAAEPGSVFTLSIVRARERVYTIWANQGGSWLLSATGEEVESHEEEWLHASEP